MLARANAFDVMFRMKKNIEVLALEGQKVLRISCTPLAWDGCGACTLFFLIFLTFEELYTFVKSTRNRWHLRRRFGRHQVQTVEMIFGLKAKTHDASI